MVGRTRFVIALRTLDNRILRPFDSGDKVQVDSGSSDLWIDASALDLPGAHHTGYKSTTEYGYGLPCQSACRLCGLTVIHRDGSSAGGEIVLANVTMGEFTVVNQALSTFDHSSHILPPALMVYY